MVIDFYKIGNSGLQLSSLTFGSALTIGTESNDFGYASELIDTAWNCGIRSFDTSNNYGGAESLLSKALSKYSREQYVISTKGSWPIGDSVYHRGLSRKHIRWAFDESLKKMGLDYIDIYYAHRYDKDTSMEEIVRTYNRLIDDGSILYWATSEWPVEALIECHEVCDELGLEKPILEQFIYSYAINKSDLNGVRDFCETKNIGMLGFSPLAQGLLTGKYKNTIPKDSRIAKSDILGYDKTAKIYQQTKNRVDYFNSICDRYNVLGSHAAIQWALRQGVLPVIGASKPSQIEQNVNGLNVVIDDAFWDELALLETEI